MITRRSMTIILAYLHQSRCSFLPSRGLAPYHIRTLCSWLDYPEKPARTMRKMPNLAWGFTVLQVAGLIDVSGGVWYCLPAVGTWINSSFDDQIKWLHQACQQNVDRWQNCLIERGWEDTLPPDICMYREQQLMRILERGEQRLIPSWIKLDGEKLVMPLNNTFPPRLLFYLLQCGDYPESAHFQLTPLSIQRAALNGYELQMILDLLQLSIAQPIPVEFVDLLSEWYGRYNQYRLRPVYLLETNTADQMAHLRQKRRINDYIADTISARAVVIRPTVKKPLTRWLAQQNYRLMIEEAPGLNHTTLNGPAHYAWLSMKVLQQLGALIGDNVRPTDHLLDSYATALTAEELSDLAVQADQIVANIESAIRGKDSFFPSECGVDNTIKKKIEGAIASEKNLFIHYQGLRDDSPRRRQIYPQWLEQQGGLFYLTAYCLTMEDERVFRLDRIKQVEETIS